MHKVNFVLRKVQLTLLDVNLLYCNKCKYVVSNISRVVLYVGLLY